MRAIMVRFLALLICVSIGAGVLHFEAFAGERAVGQGFVSAFFAGNQDIPVMPGLVELPGRSFSYDKPEGEISEIVAGMGLVSADQVIYYYDSILPQFGWNKVMDTRGDGGRYYRKNEYLDISFVKDGKENLAKIMIRPSR